MFNLHDLEAKFFKLMVVEEVFYFERHYLKCQIYKWPLTYL